MKRMLSLLIVFLLSCQTNHVEPIVELKPKPAPNPTPNPDINPEPVYENIIYVESDNQYAVLKTEFAKNPENSILLYCWADWCLPCKEVARAQTIEKLAVKYKRHKIYFLKVRDTCTRTLKLYNISVLPTMVIGKQHLTGSNGITVENVSLIIESKIK